MNLLKNLLKNLNTKVITYKSHQHLPGYVKLLDYRNIDLVRSYGYSQSLTSKEFEELQKKVEKDNIKLSWQN